MKKNSFYKFLHEGVWLSSLICVMIVSLLNFFYTANISYDNSEFVTISCAPWGTVLELLLLAVAAAVLCCCRERIEKLEGRKLFFLFSILYTVAAVYLILNVDPLLRADAKQVFQAAVDIRNGDYSALQTGKYLYRYPHQLGLVSYMRLLMKFSENPQFVFLVNFLMVLGINYAWWKISHTVFEDPFVSFLTILLSFCFLPQLMFILFAYSLIPGFFFLSLGFYHTVRFLKEKRIRNLLLMAVCLGIASLLKQNYLIGCIAVILVLALKFLAEPDRRLMAGIAAVVLAVTVPGNFVTKSYEQQAGVTLDNGCPSVLWVVMGTDLDNERRGPGWYNSYNWNTYNDARYDAEAASRMGMEKLAQNLEKIRKDPDSALAFFMKKTISQWCEPMFQSVWSGPLESSGQYTHTELLQSVYNGEHWEKRISTISGTVCLTVWLMTLAFLAFCEKRTRGWELFALYFVGGFLFHMIWEGKSQYTYTYVFSLIPLAAFAAAEGIRKLQVRLKNHAGTKRI